MENQVGEMIWFYRQWRGERHKSDWEFPKRNFFFVEPAHLNESDERMCRTPCRGRKKVAREILTRISHR